MKSKTIEVLKNFAGINQGIILHEGNVVRTMAVTKNIFATATVEDVFPREIAIYNLNEFLSVLSLFEEPEISYGDDNEGITIRKGKTKVRYQYSSPAVIVSPPKDKTIPVRNEQLAFFLKKEELQGLLKAASVLKAGDLFFSKEGITATNKKGNDNLYKVDIDDVEGDSTETFPLKLEHLKIIPQDYTVRVAERVIAFDSTDGNLSYILTIDNT